MVSTGCFCNKRLPGSGCPAQVGDHHNLAILGTSAKIVLLADETKFPGVGIRDVCTAKRISTLVTSRGADPRTLEAFRKAGSEVVLA